MIIKETDPILIFGPCSAESREQVLATAKGIKQNFDKVIFRAGIWKPRTRPGNFEGIGSEALEWLVEVKEKFGFEIATEVANTDHVESCLKLGIDHLWVGARTTVNPFSVQEIAEALKGVDTSVMIKNPIHPDFNLWLGAIERFEKAGIDKLTGIHRGFQYFDNGPYRNYPAWDLAMKMKIERPDLMLICDASHISGNPSLIPVVAQKALDLDMDGLMIETHITPEIALSDAKQQVTPEQLFEIFSNLNFKKPSSTDAQYKTEIEKLRSEIDLLDEIIIDNIGKRMGFVGQIGDVKTVQNVTIFQKERWAYVDSQYQKYGKALKLSDKFIRDFLVALHNESIKTQEDKKTSE